MEQGRAARAHRAHGFRLHIGLVPGSFVHLPDAGGCRPDQCAHRQSGELSPASVGCDEHAGQGPPCRSAAVVVGVQPGVRAQPPARHSETLSIRPDELASARGDPQAGARAAGALGRISARREAAVGRALAFGLSLPNRRDRHSLSNDGRKAADAAIDPIVSPHRLEGASDVRFAAGGPRAGATCRSRSGKPRSRRHSRRQANAAQPCKGASQAHAQRRAAASPISRPGRVGRNIPDGADSDRRKLRRLALVRSRLPASPPGTTWTFWFPTRTCRSSRACCPRIRCSRRLQSVNLRSVSGLRGTDYNGVPYFPRKLALQILDNAVLMDGQYRVPATRDHFQSLAFHAVYHKGEASGLPLSKTEPASIENTKHDYASTLRRLRRQAGERADLTLAGLDRYLARKGQQPPGDLLERYQTRNPWLRRKLDRERRDIGSAAGLIAFVVRERAADYIDEAVSVIERHGFELLHVLSLTDEERVRVAQAVRGGNWACGPFPQSGGDPVAVIVAYDFSYRPVQAADGQLINENAVFTKYKIRDQIHSRLPKSEWFNPLHSADNGWQSLECLAAVDREGLLAGRPAANRRDRAPRPAALADQARAFDDRPQGAGFPGRSPRARRDGREGFPARRGAVLRSRAHRPAGTCRLALCPRAAGARRQLDPDAALFGHPRACRAPLPRSRQVQLTFDAMRSLARFVRVLRERNYFLLDLSTHNLISDPGAGLLMLDFEFLQRYPIPTPRLYRDFTILGKAPHSSCDSPVYIVPGHWQASVRSSVFHRAICGLSSDEFFIGASLPLRVKMAIFQAFWWTAFTANGRLRSVAQRRPVKAAIRLFREAKKLKPNIEWPTFRLPMPDFHRLQHR